MTPWAHDASRVDHEIIAGLVAPGARVLDVGCGDGSLLSLLQKHRDVDGRGIELSQQGVNLCLAKGLSVIQGDADRDLTFYPSQGFDYVVLSQTLQAMRRPREVLEEMLRIGRHAVVSFPNFGHWRVRLELMTKGRMPVTRDMPFSWYDTPNIHFCTIRDFLGLCDEVGARVDEAVALNASGGRIAFTLPYAAWNMFGQQAVFLLTR